jgi:hypothetical protein
MKMYISIVVLAIFVAFTVFASGQTNFLNFESKLNSNSSVENSLDNIQLNLPKKTESNHAIVLLAIDCSNSQDSNTGRFNRTKESLERFVDRTITPPSKVGKLGIIVWNEDIIKELTVSPTPDFNNIKQKIAAIHPRGNTCVGIGLETAKVMLEKEDPSSEKFLIMLSNGKDEYCNNTRDICSIVDKINQLGIKLYIIGEKDEKGSTPCIENYKKDLSSASLENILNNISNDILNSNRQSIDQSKSNSKDKVIVEDSGPLSLSAHGKNITIVQKGTNVTISKIIENGPIGPRIVLKIKTPPPRYFDKDIVFSIDSSGSMDLGGYSREIFQAMPKVIEYLSNRNKGERINISILSWDNDVDFVYGDLNNGNDLDNATLMPLNQTKEDLNAIMKNFTSDETEATLFDEGLNNGLKILYNDPNKENPNTMRFLVLITGRSEFSNWTPDETILDKRVSIFTLGMHLDSKSKMEKSLINISTFREESYRNTGMESLEPSLVDLLGRILGTPKDNDLAKKIIELLDAAINETIMHNITVVDSVHPYLQIDGSSVRLDGKDSGFNKTVANNTIILHLEEQLRPGTIKVVSFDTRMNLSLPVDITAKQNTMLNILDSSRNNPESNVTYDWQDGVKYEINLPENEITIS